MEAARRFTVETITHGWGLAVATGQPSDVPDNVAGRCLAYAAAVIPDRLGGVMYDRPVVNGKAASTTETTSASGGHQGTNLCSLSVPADGIDRSRASGSAADKARVLPGLPRVGLDSGGWVVQAAVTCLLMVSTRSGEPTEAVLPASRSGVRRRRPQQPDLAPGPVRDRRWDVTAAGDLVGALPGDAAEGDTDLVRTDQPHPAHPADRPRYRHLGQPAAGNTALSSWEGHSPGTHLVTHVNNDPRASVQDGAAGFQSGSKVRVGAV